MFPLIISAIEDAGTRTFMEQLYMQYKRLIYSQIYKLTIDDYEADEIAQDSLVHLIEKVELLQSLPRDKLVNYIISTVKYTGYAFFRKKKRFEFISFDADETVWCESTSFQLGLDEMIIQKMESEQLYITWSQLKERDQMLLNMKYILERSNAEIADVLGVKSESVRMLLTRAKRNLSSELKKVTAN